jgi:hypothetical protein
MSWVPPEDVDTEVIPLCQALNQIPGIATFESCCGHGKDTVRIWFTAETIESLQPLLICIDPWYGGNPRWKVRPQAVDLGPPFVVFQLYFGGRKRGQNLYTEANDLAKTILANLVLLDMKQ